MRLRSVKALGLFALTGAVYLLGRRASAETPVSDQPEEAPASPINNGSTPMNRLRSLP